MKESEETKDRQSEELCLFFQFSQLHACILSHLYRTQEILKLASHYAQDQRQKDDSVDDLDWFPVIDVLAEENKAALDEMEQLETFFLDYKPKSDKQEA